MRHILHADLDAFYAAVEQLDNPELRGKPVLVGGSPTSRGVVATASYEARQYGVHSAMPMLTATHRCPEGIVVRPRFDRYREMSRQVMDIFRSLTELVEPLSLDEAYLDITEVVEQGRPALGVALDLKQQVKEETGLTLSVGVAAGKSIAKIASDFQKPDGLVVVPPGQETTFLGPLPVDKLTGVGPKSAEWLRAEGIETIGQLASQPLEWYFRRFGKRALGMHARATGQDDEPVCAVRPTKSVSAETTFPDDLSRAEDLRENLARLSATVARHLENKDLRGKTVHVKLRLADFTTFTRQTTLPSLTREESAILEAAWQLLCRELKPGMAFRLLGVGVSAFPPAPLPESGEAHQLELPIV